MSVRMRCGACGKKLKAPNNFAGRRSRCPVCRKIVRFPTTVEDTVEYEDFRILEERGRRVPPPPSVPKAKRKTFDDEEDVDWDLKDQDSPDEQGRDDSGEFSRLPPLPDRARRPKSPQRSKSNRENASDDEEPDRAAPSKAKSKPRRRKRVSDEDISNFRRLGIGLWLLLLAFLPLAWSMFFPTATPRERVAKIIEVHPEWKETIEEAKSPDEIFALFPDGRFPGAHLARHSKLHWLYAGISSLVFLLAAQWLIPGTQVKPGTLVSFGLFTGTIGVMLLLTFQWIVAISSWIGFVGRGVLLIIVLILKFIAFSYRCAFDESTGFLLSFIGFTCGVGLCEEMCKGIPVATYLANARKPDWKSVASIGFASGIGFGVSEGIMYSSDFYNGIAFSVTYIVRFVSCVTLHAIWSSAVALLMYNNQDHLPGNDSSDTYWEGIFWFIICYLSIAMVLHGLYDTLLKQELGIGALAIAIASYGWWIWLINQQIEVEADD